MSKPKAGDHVWTIFGGRGSRAVTSYYCCRRCGKPKRADGRNGLCLGAPKGKMSPHKNRNLGRHEGISS